MATTLQTLVDQTRRRLKDWPSWDQLTVSLGSSGTTATVGDTSIYRARWGIEVDYESMFVTSIASTTTLSVLRGWRGSTAVSHANSASVFIRPNWFFADIVDALNDAIGAVFPFIYKPVVDTSLTVLTNQYQYVIPNMPGYTGYPIPYIYKVEVLQPGDYTFRGTRRWEALRGAVTSGSPATSGGISSTYPILKFKSLPPITATIRIHGFGPMPPLVNLTDTLDPLFPPQCQYILTKIAAGYLLMASEARRDRDDGAAIDRREEANRPGAALQTANLHLSRGDMELLRNAMPSMPRHVKAVI